MNFIGKKLLSSKTVWVNFIALAAMIVQTATGFVVPAEYQVAALSVVNFILRLVTKEPIVWKDAG